MRYECDSPGQILFMPAHVIPKSAKLVEAYETETEIVIVGDIPDDSHLPEDQQHNCDMMGCTTLSHVRYRFKKN